MMKVAITGKSGVGKTSLCEKLFEKLRHKMSITGFVTKEVREKGMRTGFKLINLVTGQQAWLAKVGEGHVKIGKYAVLVEEFERFLLDINWDGELVVVDELGPMEFKSKIFSKIISDLLAKENLLFVIHQTFHDFLIERIRKEFTVYTLTEQNRSLLLDEISKVFLSSRY